MNNDENMTSQFSLYESAIAMHEMFQSLVGAGFTESQALYLVAQALRPIKEEGTN